MNKNVEFASGRFQGPDGKRTHDEQWEKLTKELNELGNPKDSEKWRKVSSNLYIRYV